MNDKQAIREWEDFLQGIKNATPVDTQETPEEKAKRIAWLEKEGNHEEWFKYYFPKYSFCKPAKFHVKSTNKIMKAKRLYQCRAWARGLSKSTRRMFEVFYLTFVKKHPTYAMLISKSYDNAELLLAPYKGNLEANLRLLNDYGTQQRIGKWESGKFTTRSGATFRAVGMGQNPRGAREEQIRANILIFDDADDDEVARNPDRLDQQWQWIERAVIPTVDISAPYYIFFDNNIIAEDSLALRAQKFADHVDRVNIRDEHGKSTWSEKNSEEDIDAILNSMSYESGQAEYFNNPTSKGKTFKEIHYGKVPQLRHMEYVVVYADPAPSNRDKPSLKSGAINSMKSVQILGAKENKYYLFKVWLDITSNSTFIDWLYASRDFVDGKCPMYIYIENNTLQNPFYEQVLMPLVFEKGKDHPKGVLPVLPDDRNKPEKWTRIEATLEPLVRNEQFIWNAQEKDSKHMERLETQYLTAKATSKLLDGADCSEGGIHIIKMKNASKAVGGVQTFGRRTNSKRF